MNAAHCTGSCHQGRAACTCTTACGPVVIHTRPSLWHRLRRWLRDLHDHGERMALESRLLGLMETEDEIQAEIDELRAVQFTGSRGAAVEAGAQIKAREAEMGRVLDEQQRIRGKLAELEV